jgi:2-amino-4-hydroxy-6-hydroxymethyldihydropteridine diphosphokinase
MRSFHPQFPMAPTVHTAYIALGSNLGDRAGHLRQAVIRLAEHPALCVVKASPLYESPAHTRPGEAPQPDYLNAAICICTQLSPREVLEVLLDLERLAGRLRTGATWEPRTLDLDLLAYGVFTTEEADLVVPHPHLASRRFVLAPWADIAPEFEVPAPFSARVDALLVRCPDPGPVALFAGRLLD